MGAYETSLLMLIAINVILALSLNLISGLCGQVSLGHAAFFGMGAYATALLAKAGVGLALTLPVAAVAAGALGLVVGLCSLRVRDDFLAIATMAAGFLFLGLVRTSEALGGELGISQIPDAGLGAAFPYFVVGCAVLTGLLCAVVKHSWLGYAFDAVGADEVAARSIGIDTPKYKLAAFVLGTVLAGVAGCLYAYYLGAIGAEAFGFPVSVMILAMVVIGGMGSLWGSVLAATLLTLAPEWFRFINDYKLLVFGLLLFVMMRFVPGGIVPWILVRVRRPQREGSR
ncbi:branched-chain amino acid ABC transporter permease [Variovorax paradoxus]|uniref:branched-chain amino acid ABC transporter permease n=1 Tax=Variovorax paradoxus TaxID=34073 RepID=UPI003ED097AA